MHKIIKSLCCVCMAFTLGCGDDEPTGEPTVVGALAECRSTGDDSGFKLAKVEVVVRDLDGPDDIRNVAVLAAGAVPLDMQRQDPVETEGCPSGRPICQVSYTWLTTPTNPALFCGDEGTSLELAIEVEDAAGNRNSAAVQSNPG